MDSSDQLAWNIFRLILLAGAGLILLGAADCFTSKHYMTQAIENGVEPITARYIYYGPSSIMHEMSTIIDPR